MLGVIPIVVDGMNWMVPFVQSSGHGGWVDDILKPTRIIYKDEMINVIPIPANVLQYNAVIDGPQVEVNDNPPTDTPHDGAS